MINPETQSSPSTTSRMPVLFIGHGNPMHAIDDNPFTQALARLGRELPRPRAILCASAHWMTEGSWVTRVERPRTIHDFYGFPQALFQVEYPAPGSPSIADAICERIEDPNVYPDENWGLDHGAWAVLRHMYPEADIPVLQVSIYMEQPAEYHFKLGQQLRRLRDEGILIVGSGNIVHNLRQAVLRGEVQPYDWAIEFDEWVKTRLENRDYAALQHDARQTEAGRLSIPTPDHWYPLFYPLGAADENDTLRYEYEGIDNGSISMRCFTLGMQPKVIGPDTCT